MSDMSLKSVKPQTLRRTLDDIVRDMRTQNEAVLSKIGTIQNEKGMIERLDAESAFLAVAMTDLQNAIIQRRTQLRRGRNALLPFHQLPEKLLAKILAMSLHRCFEWEHRLGDVFDLVKVCSIWRRIIMSRPEFWTVVTDRCRPEVISWQLRKSDHELLSVIYRGNAKSDVFFTITNTASWRWRSLSIWWWSDEPDMPRLGSLLTPNLTSLALSSHGNSFLHVDLPSGPPLKNVTLFRSNVPWNSPSLRFLVVLDIYEPGSPGPTLEDLEDILNGSPFLEDLSLQKIPPFADQNEFQRQPFTVINLPRMKSFLYTETEPSDLATHLMRRI
ncbi:hypothetical protein FRB99_008306 [Tulasnella sp. 403]|nr:hypothetical protein FRB99_008306 [Tulasnella sp. 403]